MPFYRSLSPIFYFHTIKSQSKRTLSYTQNANKHRTLTQAKRLVREKREKLLLFAQWYSAGLERCFFRGRVNRLRLGGCCNLESFGSCAGTSSISLMLCRCAPMMFSAVLITQRRSLPVRHGARQVGMFSLSLGTETRPVSFNSIVTFAQSSPTSIRICYFITEARLRSRDK